MSVNKLVIDATERLRILLAKNLPPYSINGQFTPNTSSYSLPITQSSFSVIDSPNQLINRPPFLGQLYRLNEFGPSGGYTRVIDIDYPNGQINSNQGIYNPIDTNLDLLNESFIDVNYNENRYGPEGGFTAMYFVSNEGTTDKIHLPYWEPPTFLPSTYSPLQVLLSNNPVGDFGLLSQDSSLAMIASKRLKSLFEDRINLERIKNITNFIGNNFTITIPESPLTPTGDFALRISSSYFPASTIPGSYYEENQKKGQQTNQTSRALRGVNFLTGGLLGPILNIRRNPSQLFLANTGSGQKSELFKNINLNQFQPDYSRYSGGVRGILNSLGRTVLDVFGNVDNDYYVGSSKKEPNGINSPRNQVPVNEFGKQIQAPVYGPTDLSILYEGNENRLNFGLVGKTMIEGGSVDSGLVWISPKYKNALGKKPTIGGGLGKVDEDYFQINSKIQQSQSTNIRFKPGSILDDTQRLVDSADKVTGKSRLKHVGNAINQVSKVFNDGYKEITKGSKVLSYVDNATGVEEGIEYGRVFTKDTPYYTYNDLQKKQGITTENRRFPSSVLDKTFNLNIAPMRGTDSTNIVKRDSSGQNFYAKKYMFSIENLAWRTSTRPGFTIEDLPNCEKGPNGGRIMWFPPYDLKFSDSSTASFQGTSFLGRPEPMYTYKDTSRSGTLSWKIIVDHPSILNVIVRKQLQNTKKEKIDSIIESFFAGCAKYDIYELAKRFPNIPASQIKQIVTALNSTSNIDDATNLFNEIYKDPSGNPDYAVNPSNLGEEIKVSEVGTKPKNKEDVLDKLRQSFTKKILRNFLTECDYFDMIKEDTPMIYDSLTEKLKYFSPTFHSTTPEGLNSRLVFLNQCVRPGETIPTIGTDNQLTQTNALNTSFGAPPILVLRIGDFFHTKIIPDGVSFSYEPLVLDQNPEGIGVQPMIVAVSMNFKIIGGMGIAKPVEELQNALSFNFYANTEVYDERATATEDLSKVSKDFFDQLKLSVLGTPSEQRFRANNGGNTIGTIVLTIPNEDGSAVGDINYKSIMDKLLSSTSNYFSGVVNILESVQRENNIGFVQILNANRDYSKGNVVDDTISIFGKSSNWEQLLNDTLERVYVLINTETDPILSVIKNGFTSNEQNNLDNVFRYIKTNMKQYIADYSQELFTSLGAKSQDLVSLQESYVQIIRKLNVVSSELDGEINNRGTAQIYNIFGQQLTDLIIDFKKLKIAMDDYVSLLSDNSNKIAFYSPIDPNRPFDLIDEKIIDEDKEIDFFVVMARIINDETKIQEFIDYVLREDELLRITTRQTYNKLVRKFNIRLSVMNGQYSRELRRESEVFSKLKNKPKYKKLTKGLATIMYKPNKERVCNYNTSPTLGTPQQKTLIENLYKTVNVNDDKSTYNDKITFN
jgi:hypothetical protein